VSDINVTNKTTRYSFNWDFPPYWDSLKSTSGIDSVGNWDPYITLLKPMPGFNYKELKLLIDWQLLQGGCLPLLEHHRREQPFQNWDYHMDTWPAQSCTNLVLSTAVDNACILSRSFYKASHTRSVSHLVQGIHQSPQDQSSVLAIGRGTNFTWVLILLCMHFRSLEN
jgi:hypothetical protein